MSMRIRLLSLELVCREETVVIDLSKQVSFFHGKMSAGKSTIARLIDYCLGSKSVEKTTAISKELVSVALTAKVGENIASFERTAEPGGSIQVSWQDGDEHQFSVLAPLQTTVGSSPLVGDSVYTFSDLMFYLFGMTSMMVRRSTLDEESPMVRLSFRDIFWYCYLDQNKLDNSFYRLAEPHVQVKSRYAIRYILGFYSERLEDLQGKLSTAITRQQQCIGATKHLRAVLNDIGYDTDNGIFSELETLSAELARLRELAKQATEVKHFETHPVEGLRADLRRRSDELAEQEQSLDDLRTQRAKLESLRAELITARQKLNRTSAASILSGVEFDSCPRCGTHLSPPEPDHCRLCRQVPTKPGEGRGVQAESVKRDFTSRIEELDESIQRMSRGIHRHERLLGEMVATKQKLDQQLQVVLYDYDAVHTARVRENDREIARIEERVRSLQRVSTIPQSIQKLTDETVILIAEQERLRSEIEQEVAKLNSADSLVRDLEETYLSILLQVGVPGVREDDKVEINRRTWIPDIIEGGGQGTRWNFYTAGSNGKKTMLNVCYALAVHKVAEDYGRPLPSVLIIDHPMKCTSPDVNRDVFESFYKVLYGMVRSSLKHTQVILIDNDFFAPSEGIDYSSRYMTPSEDENPPLIPYYRGA